jgi:hypothetical protein
MKWKIAPLPLVESMGEQVLMVLLQPSSIILNYFNINNEAIFPDSARNT